MTELDGWLHYRIVDVSSIKELARRWYPRVYFASPTKAGGHRALADIRESIEELKYYRDVLSTDPKVRKAADDWLLENEPLHSSMLRTSVSPNIFTGGYRSNVIPSEAKATLDVRALPDAEEKRSGVGELVCANPFPSRPLGLFGRA